LNMKEIKALCQKLGDTMSAKALEEAFERMDPEMTGEVRNWARDRGVFSGRGSGSVRTSQGRSEHLPCRDFRGQAKLGRGGTQDELDWSQGFIAGAQGFGGGGGGGATKCTSLFLAGTVEKRCGRGD
jgi:hypothetical protein